MSQWVLLHNPQQGAYHIETLAEYRSKPANGYSILSVGGSRAEVERVYRQVTRQQKSPLVRAGK
jgi:hypothetical protein